MFIFFERLLLIYSSITNNLSDIELFKLKFFTSFLTILTNLNLVVLWSTTLKSWWVSWWMFYQVQSINVLLYWIDYNPIGPRFSNTVAQALLVLCKNLPPAVSVVMFPWFFIINNIIFQYLAKVLLFYVFTRFSKLNINAVYWFLDLSLKTFLLKT